MLTSLIGEKTDTSTDEEDVPRAQLRISHFIKPSNKDGNFDYNILRAKPYWTQQKCAKVFRQGNLLLAGDAAHTNNPMDGLGLTGGILDAVVFGNVLVRYLKRVESDELHESPRVTTRDLAQSYESNVTNELPQAILYRE